MEKLNDKLNREGKTLTTATSSPLDPKPGYYGALAEDHGCTLKLGSPTKNALDIQVRSGYQKFNSATTQPPSPKTKTRAVTRLSNRPADKNNMTVTTLKSAAWKDKRTYSNKIEFSESGLEDEMDLFTSRADDPSSFQKPVTCNRFTKTQDLRNTTKDTQKLKGGSPRRDVHIDSNGREHLFHPKFRPSNVYSRMKFKKTKNSQVSN